LSLQLRFDASTDIEERTKMFKKILIAQDGSKGSKRVMPLAIELARSNDAELVIAHVDEQTLGKGGGSINAVDDDLQRQLRHNAEELSADGLETSFEVRSVVLGGPAHVLAQIADDVGADLIMAGSRGHSPISGLVLGSVAQRLLQVARQPVLVVPESARLAPAVEHGRATAGVV
jgi:nucleotide-binding universal stress UspA family protein